MANQWEHAVVVGCSIAGMSQAAVLRRYFKRVTIVEANKIDLKQPSHRLGVPHDRQLHGLLNRGLVNLERFLPGFKEQLMNSGVAKLEYGRNVAWYMNGTWWSEIPSGINAVGFTRPHFENVLRKRLLREPNVTLIDGATVSDFLSNDELSVVTGVELEKGGTKKTLLADLVVDCTGRHSQSLKRLNRLGCPEIPSEEIEIDVHYVTQLVRFERPPAANMFYVGFEPPKGRRMGVLIKAEKDLYIIGLGGILGDVPPRDKAGIAAFLESLPTPALADVCREMIPVTEPSSYRFKSNFRRYFSRMKNLPERLVFSGDVVCSFDPVYGQGMTTATMGSDVMDRCLRRRRPNETELIGLSAEFQRDLGRMLDQPWMQALANDLLFPEVKAPRPLAMRFMMSYSHWLLSTMHLRRVHDRVILVFHMLRSPVALFHPLLIGCALLARLGIIRPCIDIPKIARSFHPRNDTMPLDNKPRAVLAEKVF